MDRKDRVLDFRKSDEVYKIEPIWTDWKNVDHSIVIKFCNLEIVILG